MSRRGDSRRRAVALQYEGDAPRVTASGHGELAEQIIALAAAHDVPLEEDADLVRLLSRVELGEEIPETLYQAVAEILAFALLVSGRAVELFGERREPEG